MDLHFQSYVLNQLPTNQFPLLLSATKDPKLYTDNYCRMLHEIVRVKAAEKYGTEQSSREQWCNEQIRSIVANSQDYLKEVRVPVIEGVQDDHLESLLIGMLGWGSDSTEEAVRLLNAYYDRSDWQISAPFKPVISYAHKKFHINYLIEDVPNTEQELVFLVKAWTMNP